MGYAPGVCWGSLRLKNPKVLYFMFHFVDERFDAVVALM